MAMALLAGLEIPPPGTASTARPASEPQGYDPREYLETPFDLEGHAPARPVRTYASLGAAYKRKKGLPHSGERFEPDYRILRDGLPRRKLP